MVKEIKLLYSDESIVGLGKDKDPVRGVTKLYTHDGKLILSFDNWTKEVYLDNETLKNIPKTNLNNN